MPQKSVIQQLLLISILLLSLFLQLNHLNEVQVRMPGHNILCGGDSIGYDQNGQALLRGNWPGDQPFETVPLYSFYLGLVYGIFGVNYTIPLIVQMLVGVVGCAALFRIGKICISSLTGVLAAMAMALYGSVISYQVCYAPVALTTPLLLLSTLFLVQFGVSRKALYLVVSGIFLGLTALSRPTMLILAPVTFAWIVFRDRQFSRFITAISWFVFGLILVLLPSTVHNFRTSGKIIPISDQGEINFYYGNNMYGSGIGPHGVASQAGARAGNQFLFATEHVELKTRVSRGETTYFGHVVDYVFAHPIDWGELIFQKIYLMFIEPDWKLILVNPFYPTSSAALMKSPFLRLFPVEWVGLFVGSLLATLFIRSRYFLLFWGQIFSVSAVLVLFFIKFRFRLPLTPFLLLMSMALVAHGRDWFIQDRRKFVVGLLTMLALSPFIPSFLIITILYLAVGLFPYHGTRSLWQFRWQALAIWCYVVLIGFGLQVFAVRFSNAQTQNYFAGPEIWGPTTIGQSFVPNCNGLHRIDIDFSRLGFGQKQPYFFDLATGHDFNHKIYSTQFSVNDVGRTTQKRFYFPPQKNSKDQEYFFFIRSPEANPGSTVTVRLYPDFSTIYKNYDRGSIYAGFGDNLQPFPGDIAFVAYCRESLVKLFGRTIDHLADSGPSFATPVVYYGAFFGHIFLFLVVLYKLWHLHF